MRRRLDASAERVRHQLHAVADSEHRAPDVVNRRIACWRAGVGDALRTAGEDDTGRIARADSVDRRIRRPYFRVDRKLAQAACDELRVLRPEVENDDGLMGQPGSPGWRERSPGRDSRSAVECGQAVVERRALL